MLWHQNALNFLQKYAEENKLLLCLTCVFDFQTDTYLKLTNSIVCVVWMIFIMNFSHNSLLETLFARNMLYFYNYYEFVHKNSWYMKLEIMPEVLNKYEKQLRGRSYFEGSSILSFILSTKFASRNDVI